MRFAKIATLLFLLVPGEAAAHAFLDRANPPAGNTVATAPREVRLWFTGRPQSALSSITVTDETGQRVDNGKVRISGYQVTVSLRPIGAGSYRVMWHVFSVDAHTTSGNFSFRVSK